MPSSRCFRNIREETSPTPSGVELIFYEGRQTKMIIKDAALKVINVACRTEVQGQGHPRCRQVPPYAEG